MRRRKFLKTGGTTVAAIGASMLSPEGIGQVRTSAEASGNVQRRLQYGKGQHRIGRS